MYSVLSWYIYHYFIAQNGILNVELSIGVFNTYSPDGVNSNRVSYCALIYYKSASGALSNTGSVGVVVQWWPVRTHSAH